nr:hypothetical protein HmN_000513300 [Hymenolepis microstoma]
MHCLYPPCRLPVDKGKRPIDINQAITTMLVPAEQERYSPAIKRLITTGNALELQIQAQFNLNFTLNIPLFGAYLVKCMLNYSFFAHGRRRYRMNIVGFCHIMKSQV